MIIRILSIIEKKGIIRSSVSTKLTEIRNDLQRKSQSVNQTISKILHQVRASGLVDHKTEIPIKDGRFVIQVPATNKRNVKGIIHEKSDSGQTVYIKHLDI